MDKVFISNQIKFDILTISGKPALQPYNLLTNTPLYAIGYNEDDMCRQLEYKLQLVAEEYKTGKSISSGSVSKNLTVRECIQLVIL